MANDKWWGTKPVTTEITVWPRSADLQDRVNDGTYDVVDIATGSSGTLNLPDDYVRTDSPSAGIEQLIFAPQGPLAAVPARRALALCTPRDVIARNAGVPVANSRLNTATEDAYGAAETTPAGRPVRGRPTPTRPAPRWTDSPLTVRIGYQTPNARLAATVGRSPSRARRRASPSQDAAGQDVGPQALRDNEIDVLIASTGGAAGSGSTGSSADGRVLAAQRQRQQPAAATQRARSTAIIATLAVTSDPKETGPPARRGGARSCGPTCRRCRCTVSSAHCSRRRRCTR